MKNNLLDKLKQHLNSITTEQFKEEWKDIEKTYPSDIGIIDIKELIEMQMLFEQQVNEYRKQDELNKIWYNGFQLGFELGKSK